MIMITAPTKPVFTIRQELEEAIILWRKIRWERTSAIDERKALEDLSIKAFIVMQSIPENE